MANEVMAEEQEAQLFELVSYLESIESAKWSMYRDAQFLYNIKLEYEDFISEADKFFKTLKEKQK